MPDVNGVLDQMRKFTEVSEWELSVVINVLYFFVVCEIWWMERLVLVLDSFSYLVIVSLI